MQLSKDLRNIDKLAVLLSVLILSITVSLAISLTIFNQINYLIVGAVVIVYSLIAIKTTKPFYNYADTPKDTFNYPVAVALGAICIGLLLYGNQFEYASLWGDHGVYVTEASHLRGNGETPFSFANIGFDLETNTELKPANGINHYRDGLWQFHGLPTWPAFMAASKLPNNGLPVLAILYSINVILFFVAAKYFSKESRNAAFATLLFASLPLLWHQALYATAEMLLLSVFLSTLVASLKLNHTAIHLSVGLFAYGAVHTGVLILSPAIGIILFIFAFFSNRTNRSKLGITGFFCAFAALLSYKFAIAVSTKYTGDITSALFGEHTYLAYTACLAPLIAGIPSFLQKITPDFFAILKRYSSYTLEHFNHIAAAAIIGLATIILVQAYLLGWTQYYMPESLSEFNSWSARSGYIDRGIRSLAHLSIANIFAASGGLGLIAFVIIPFYKKFNFRTKLLWTFTLVFIIVLGVYRVDIPNNYYASRYFLPILVPCLLILFATTLKGGSPLKYLTFPAVIVAFAFNGPTIGKGFFIGDNYLKNHLLENLDKEGIITLHGSKWLRYMVYPVLLERSTGQSNNSPKTSANDNIVTPTSYLITDSKNVLGGNKNCIEYIERRIPWKIIYPTKPQLHVRNACIVTPDAIVNKTLELPGNDKIVDGQYNFVLVKPKDTHNITVEISSSGLWARKAPFVDNINSLNPQLHVCGNPFTAEMISPQKIIFKGYISSEFCKAKFLSKTFTPTHSGEKNPPTSSGIDIYAISIMH